MVSAVGIAQDGRSAMTSMINLSLPEVGILRDVSETNCVLRIG